MDRRSLCAVLILMAVTCILVSGCASKNDSQSYDSYIVIEEVRQENAEIIEGWLYEPQIQLPFMNDATPVPIFPDDPDRYGVTVNGSLHILYFSYYSLYGPYRNITFVRGIYSFPYQLASNVTIYDIDQNGTIHMSYDNQSIDLAHGKTWKSPVVSSRIENRTGYNGSIVKIKYHTYWWILNEPNSYMKK